MSCRTRVRQGGLSLNRADIIERIMNLTDEQLEMLFTLYSQQDEEFDPDVQALRPTSA